MKTQNKRTAFKNANKTFKAKGKKGQKRIDKTQQSGSSSMAKPPSGNANDKKGSSTKAGSSSVTLPIHRGRGLCSLCRFRPHDNKGSGSDDNRPILVEEAEKVALFKKFMKELGYLGSGDKGLGDCEDVKYCYPCGRVMEYVWDRYKESVRAIRGVLDNPTTTEEEQNQGMEESEMTPIIVKHEEFDEDVSSYQEEVGTGAEGFLTLSSSLTMEMADDPLDEALATPQDDSEMMPIVVKEEELDEDNSSYQEDVGEVNSEDDSEDIGAVDSEENSEDVSEDSSEDDSEDDSEDVGEEGFLTPQTTLSTEVEIPLALMDPMDEALGNPEIVSTILSFLDTSRTFLSCRLLNSFWNEQVLKTYPSRGRCSLNVDSYMKERKPSKRRKAHLLPQGSLLATRVSLASSVEPKAFLSFFENGEGKVTEFLSLDLGFGYPSLALGKALQKILKNNWAPNLRELEMRQRVLNQGKDVYEDWDFSKSLENLKALTIRSSRWEEEDISGRGFPFFVKSILRGAENLETLELEGPFFPVLAAIKKMKNLDSLHLGWERLGPWAPALSAIPELERVLSQVSTNCLRLEELCLRLPSEELVTRFPRFPQLKKFIWNVKGLLSSEKDLIRFLKKKMPGLRNLTVSDTNLASCNQSGEAFIRALQSSKGRFEVLEFLYILAPQDFSLLKGLMEKFPSLKGLRVDWNILPFSCKYDGKKSTEDRVAELGVVVAKEFPSVPATIIVSYKPFDGEEVRKKFLKTMGHQYKGRVTVITLSPNSVTFDRKGIRLNPEKKI